MVTIDENNPLSDFVTARTVKEQDVGDSVPIFACPEYHGLIEKEGMKLITSQDPKHVYNHPDSEDFIFTRSAIEAIGGKTDCYFKLRDPLTWIYFRYFCSHKGTGASPGTLFTFYTIYDNPVLVVKIEADRKYAFYGIDPSENEYLIGKTDSPVMENKKGYITIYYDVRNHELYLLERDKELLFASNVAYTDTRTDGRIGKIEIKGQDDPITGTNMYLSQFMVTLYEPSYQYLISNDGSGYGLPDFYTENPSFYRGYIDEKPDYFTNGLNKQSMPITRESSLITLDALKPPHTWNFMYYNDANGKYISPESSSYSTTDHPEYNDLLAVPASFHGVASLYKGTTIDISTNAADQTTTARLAGHEIVGVGLSMKIKNINTSNTNINNIVQISLFVDSNSKLASLDNDIADYVSTTINRTIEFDTVGITHPPANQFFVTNQFFQGNLLVQYGGYKGMRYTNENGIYPYDSGNLPLNTLKLYYKEYYENDLDL